MIIKDERDCEVFARSVTFTCLERDFGDPCIPILEEISNALALVAGRRVDEMDPLFIEVRGRVTNRWTAFTRSGVKYEFSLTLAAPGITDAQCDAFSAAAAEVYRRVHVPDLRGIAIRTLVADEFDKHQREQCADNAASIS